uniref:Transthyretin-like family protein n=1 Tax=Strongyloides papillosus TaxID=174720 RepID=A0A0N5BVN1_STREA
MLQNVEIRGKILCNGKAVSQLKIELYEEDIFSNTFMDKTYTNESGYFTLTGKDNEYSRIDPYIIFTYTCPIYNKPSTHDTKIFYVSEDIFQIYRLYSSYYYNYGNIELSRILKIIN